MTSNLALLKLLADGQIHSGDELSLLTGVSRTAIWKQLQRLQLATGLKLEAIRGRGYRISGGLELLDRDLVMSMLSPAAKSWLMQLDVREQVDSTNVLALQRAMECASGGYAVVAEQQLAGRGRRGRAWVSPYGCNLYCSTVWQFHNGAAALEGLSLAVGVAVARALKAVGIEGVQLKWPNDILWKGRKLAGILLEMTGDVAGLCQVVVGIGINVSMPEGAAASVIEQPWTNVNTAVGSTVSRNELLAGLLSELLPALVQFEHSGFVPFRSEWASMDAMLGRAVTAQLGAQTVVGVAAGVGDTGALAVDTELGRQWLYGGEVTLRLQG